MKKFTTLLALSLVSFGAIAGEISFKTADFQVKSVSLMCPTPKPGEVTCTALGGHVVVEATLGCLDKLLFSHFELSHDGRSLRAVSVVRSDSDNDRVRCARANKVIKKVFLAKLSTERLDIINEEIR